MLRRGFYMAAMLAMISPAMAAQVTVQPPSYTITVNPPKFSFTLPDSIGGPSGANVKGITIDAKGHLIFTLSTGATIDAGALPTGTATTTPTTTTTPPVTTTPTTTAPPVVTSTDDITAKFFPPDPGVAAFPSPENSRIVRLGTSISGRPYLLAKDGSVHQLVAQSPAFPNGYAVNGNKTGGGGNDEAFSVAIVRQGTVYVQRSTGQWQQFNPGMGSIYNAALPDPFSTDASGNTTSTVATSSVKAPTPAPRAAILPGTSGKTIKVCATGCDFTTITAAFDAASNGDTVDIGPQTFKETPHAIAVSLKVNFQPGAKIDATGLTATLAHGKGVLVPMSDLLLVNPVITGTAMDQGSAQGTAAIRPETGNNYIDIQGGELYGNQNAVAGGDIPTTVTMTGTYLHDNGLGDGYTHNVYMSGGTIALNLINVRSVNPNGGHAIKSRAFDTKITGGEFEAFSAAAIDIPQGSVSQAVIDGAIITKKAGAYNHAVVDYASENNLSGNGGLLIKNSTLNLNCDNPFFNVGGGSVVTWDASNKLVGTKPTVQGGKLNGL